ncbi:MAG: NUDIX domain-containing protein [Candidatus Limnocylindrales bacterium]|nr:NUDIX domain-containing protein [Candidatus Limnocylindrales bacterium]
MSPIRPDLVDCWIYRAGAAEPEILLIRRAPGRILPGLWQCVSGSVEGGERIATAVLRELHEETGFGREAIEAFYDLDLVNQFHEPSFDAVVSSAVFAVRISAGREPRLSNEHDGSRWLPLSEAHREVVWPGYRTALERIRDDLADAARASWFELTLDGQRRERW